MISKLKQVIEKTKFEHECKRWPVCYYKGAGDTKETINYLSRSETEKNDGRNSIIGHKIDNCIQNNANKQC